MAAKPVLFVFDLDDTLYVEREYSCSALQFFGDRVAQEFGLQGAAEELMARFKAGDGDAIGRFWQEHALPETERLPLLEAMRAHVPDINLRPDAARLLGQLRLRQWPFAIISDGRSITQRAKIEALGIDDAALISISEECGFPKTDPRRLQPLIDCFPGYQFLLIGDNPAKDFVAANRLGWKTFMVRDQGFNIHVQGQDFGTEFMAQVTIAVFEELWDHVNGLA